MEDFNAFIGEIRVFAANYAPQGWLECKGQAVPINQYRALFSIIGNLYGTPHDTLTFLLPYLQEKVLVSAGEPIGSGSSYSVGKTGGGYEVGLHEENVPLHTHILNGAVANQIALKLVPEPDITHFLSNPAETATSPSFVGQAYFTPSADIKKTGNLGESTMTRELGTEFGSARAHDNLQPTLPILHFICAEGGIYPST